MNKILMIISSRPDNSGGATKVMFDSASSLIENGYQVCVASMPGGKWNNAFTKEGMTVKDLPRMRKELNPILDLICIFDLIKTIKSGEYVAVNCHSSKAGLLGGIAASICNTPVKIFNIHGWSSYRDQTLLVKCLNIFVEFMLVRLFHYLVCVCENDKEYALKHKLKPRKGICVIRNGIDVDLFNSGKKTSAGIINDLINDGDTVIGMIGRLSRQKQPLFFIDIAHELLKSNDRLKFFLIGDGPLKNECEKRISSRGLEGNIFLLGDRDDVAELLKSIQIFVLPSAWEGLPLTILEAMAMGIPVIASQINGIPEIIDSGEDGFLVEKNYFRGFVEKVELLLKDKQLYEKISRNAVIKVEEKFTKEKMEKKYLDFFTFSLGNKKNSGI